MTSRRDSRGPDAVWIVLDNGIVQGVIREAPPRHYGELTTVEGWRVAVAGREFVRYTHPRMQPIVLVNGKEIDTE